MMTRIRYQVGLDAVLDDPADPRPGGFCRDVVLAHIGDALSSFFEDLEVRELLSADLPMACGREEHEGELLVMAAPGVGGALPPAQAARVIDGLATLGRSGSLREGLFPDTEDRGVLVPPWVPPAGRFGFPPPHPLAGVAWSNMVSVAKHVRSVAEDDAEAAKLVRLLDLCTREKLVVSWIRIAQ
ncbi:MAG: hypothetical protein RIB77_40605 [Sandaracinaceae bacterium]